MKHEPVLLPKVLSLVKFEKGQTVLDGTLGAGGYTKAILERIGAEGKLIVLDRDIKAIEFSKGKLKEHKNIAFCHVNYANFEKALDSEEIRTCDRMVLDLGLSRDQIEERDRGFSFTSDGPLDMRMDTSEDGIRAGDVVNTFREADLADLIWKWGEERYSRRIAKAICRARAAAPIETSKELAEIIKKNHPRKFSRIHPATRTFQALRIHVNREIECLEEFLEKFPKYLKKQGRLGIVTFHSLEDRAVKHRFRELAKTGEFSLINKKVERADEAEAHRNPASRSAKLRVIERN